MELGIDGKLAMVAAGSKGIGFATVRMLLREGAQVSFCARTLESIDSALASLVTEFGEAVLQNVKGVQADVSSLPDLENWFSLTKEAFGAVSILITNTGGPPAGELNRLTDEQWQNGFDSTLLNVVRMVRLASDDLKSSGWGRIVHITSLVAKEPHALLPISSALRAGIQSMTRLQSNEFAPFGVTVNGVLPGHTMTDRQIHLAGIRASQDGISVDQALQLQAKTVPMQRLADADEVASAIVFLSSDAASYITGVNLLVDGGLTRGIG